MSLAGGKNWNKLEKVRAPFGHKEWVMLDTKHTDVFICAHLCVCLCLHVCSEHTGLNRSAGKMVVWATVEGLVKGGASAMCSLAGQLLCFVTFKIRR